jgi:hypothetical protein
MDHLPLRIFQAADNPGALKWLAPQDSRMLKNEAGDWYVFRNNAS